MEASNDARKIEDDDDVQPITQITSSPSKKNNDYTHEPKVTRNRYGEAYAAYAKLLLEMREEGDAAQL